MNKSEYFVSAPCITEGVGLAGLNRFLNVRFIFHAYKAALVQLKQIMERTIT